MGVVGVGMQALLQQAIPQVFSSIAKHSTSADEMLSMLGSNDTKPHITRRAWPWEPNLVMCVFVPPPTLLGIQALVCMIATPLSSDSTRSWGVGVHTVMLC